MSEPPALPPAPLASPATAGPFRFLHYFEEGDPAFAGRDREIREVVAGILRTRTLVLYGRSGLGKTSLLLAGVFPALRERGLEPVYVRVFDAPLEDLRAALEEAFPGGGFAAGAELGPRLAALEGQGPVVLVLDQLEELFIRFRDKPKVRAGFIAAVAELLTAGGPQLRVVFSLREDYLANLDDFRTLLPDLFANEYRLHPLSAFGTRQAISRALQVAGIEYEQRLLTGMVDELAKERYDPSILQILGSELERETAPARLHRQLSAEDLKTLGGVDGIFRRYWTALLEELRHHPNPEMRLVVLAILERLVTDERTKQAVTVASLCQGSFRTTPEEVEQGLEILIAHRLVRPLDGGRYELIHDRLVEHVERWLKQDLVFMGLRNARDRVAAVARDEGFRTEPDLLLTAGQLSNVVGKHKERLTFSELELEVLLRSAIYQRSPDLAYWAERYGTAKSPELLFDLLHNPKTEVRRGAAEAVDHLRQGSDELADLCLRLALEDEDEKVRRAAGRSLVRWLGSAQEEELAEKLYSRRTRGAALEVLGDFLEADAMPQSFSWFWRLCARYIVRERRLSEHRELIHQRGRLGMLLGAFAGSLFILVFMALPLSWTLWKAEGFTGLKALGLASSVGLCAVVILGGFLGWRLAVINAKVAATRGEGLWARSAWRTGWFFFVFLLPLFDWTLDAGEIGALATALALHVLFAALLRPARLCLEPEISRAGLWLRVSLLSLGLLSLIPLVIQLAELFRLEERFRLPWALASTALSFSFFVAVVVLSHVERRPLLRLGPLPCSRQVSRRLAWYGAVACFGATWAFSAWLSSRGIEADMGSVVELLLSWWTNWIAPK